jgi:hypothetical protein
MVARSTGSAISTPKAAAGSIMSPISEYTANRAGELVARPVFG